MTDIILIKRLSLFVVVSFLNLSFVSAKDLNSKPFNSVEEHFNQVITSIDSTLWTDQAQLKSDKSHLESFVDANILPHWNIDLTLKQLVGGKNWRAFTKVQINDLEVEFNKTMHRYVREGMSYYDGQRVKLLNVKLNKKNTRGVVTVQMQPVYLPAFKIVFKIANNRSATKENWLLYDVLIEGISYVKMKKNEYRRLINDQGVEGLLAFLDKKNKIVELSTNQSNIALKNAN